LRLSESCPIAFIGESRQLRSLPANDPSDFVLSRLTAFGAGQVVGSHLCCLVEKLPFLHPLFLRFSEKAPPWKTPDRASQIKSRHFRPGPTSSILILGRTKRKGMTKHKPGKFSVTKAVKANARERVGQPKPVRVVDEKARTGRKVKHKPKLEQVIRLEE
jgi:hypothetical protein